ncbi:protein FMC1 homolog [Ischnura elegans]|uniref:protein FMC1 homolog n=1 Tax=Ischnura elegans TaxID=197161 RepID=UPI001ED8B7BF|nr:protein FMC1 homolog [Ischnura elegans]
MAGRETISTLRSLLSELRKCSSQGSKFHKTSQAKFVMDQYRANQVTDLQYCKAQEEMKYTASTYLSFLRSKRLYSELLAHYKGKGEKSVQETASQLEFKLPHDPK